ncbi:MAG: hypothetical protein B7Z73_18820 [Planctomycetia bacterium 21-64-5]|nr:MAG: hypothetical protein B7Z73_18820 [Planctomycetia bacterium 21-64-5]
MPPKPLSATEQAAYERDGYLLLRSLFDAEEMAILLDYARNDESLMASAYGRKDVAGRETRLALWNQPGENLYGLFSRSPRIVDRAEQLLDQGKRQAKHVLVEFVRHGTRITPALKPKDEGGGV